MSETLVKVENVSKRFCRDLKKSLWYGIKDMSSALFTDKQNNTLRPAEFWAVKNVSFELKRGECLGLIGHNGAGKSTLLKILNGLIRPDEGKITMNGRIGALIELGAGFNPILTGRENIYNNGAVLGFSKKEIDSKVNTIIKFSEIGDFIDTPVQNYSSGMKVRLGFAVAAQMEPDVLIIDEVLAVGDLGFKVKCMTRIQELLKSCAVIFVSHAMPQIAIISTKISLMDHGKIEYGGTDIGKGIEMYFSKFNSSKSQVISSHNTKVEKFEILGNTENEINSVRHGDSLAMKFKIKTEAKTNSLSIRLGIFNMEYRLLGECDSLAENVIIEKNQYGSFSGEIEIPNLYLRYGRYNIHIHVTNYDTKEKILRQSNIAEFVVKETFTVGADFLLPSIWT